MVCLEFLQPNDKGDCALNEHPIFIDLEASGLGPHGFPTQVAWGRLNGATDKYYIAPDAEWLIEDGWDPNAEMLTGIRLEVLRDEGKPAGWVAEEMNRKLRGETLYSDGLQHDSMWVDQLFECTPQEREFEIRDFWGLIDECLPSRKTRRFGWESELKIEVQRKLRRKDPSFQIHCAENDVLVLIELWQIYCLRNRGEV